MGAPDRLFAELRARFQEARSVLDFEALRNDVVAGEKEMSSPDFWSDQNHARKRSQEVAQKKALVESWESFENDLQAAQDLLLEAPEGDPWITETHQALEKRLQILEVSTLFTGSFDDHDAIVSVRAGAGGTDAADWASMLLRMIVRFAEREHWEVEVLEESLAEEAGIKSAMIAVRGLRAYGYLQNEAGVHRLVRISPFDAEKMRHTSFAQIEVIPEIDDIEEKNIEIDPKDLRIDTFMAGGHGGQSVNTTYSAVRVTHIPTNIVVSCQNERSQQQNREVAMRVLKSRLFQQLALERKEKIDDLRGGHVSADWGNQIRSYVLHPYKMVKDHRTDYETQDVAGVLDGDIMAFIEAHLRLKAKQ
ncbi:MAG: peptide chain release factor 2 [Patescibacteria group bacterium]|jgi:peptide chain release factor 2